MIKIKKIITAIGNPKINKELALQEEYEIIGKDISYREGIIDFLEVYNDIDLIILSEKLVGEISFEELISKIKEIKNNINIIFILIRENEKIEKLLKKAEINYIYNSEDYMKYLKSYIKQGKTKIESTVVEGIDSLSNIDDIKIVKDKKGIVICFYGERKVGKTTVCSELGSNIKNRKVLIVDADFENQDIHTLLNVKKYSTKVIDKNSKLYIYENNAEKIINSFILKINKNLHILSGLDLIKEYLTKELFEDLIKKLTDIYDIVLIDMATDNKINNKIFYLCNKIIFLMSTDILGIKSSKKIIEKLKTKYDIKNNKINIILNKSKKNSINIQILEKVFFDFKIIKTKETNRRKEKKYLDIIDNI